MKAAVPKDFDRLVLEEAPDPEPGWGEVVVRIREGGEIMARSGATGASISTGEDASSVIQAAIDSLLRNPYQPSIMT